MSNDLRFSVLMPVYFKENPEYFNTALESIVNQTLKPNEIVIVKDGALTQELDTVIKEYVSKFPQLFNIVSLEKKEHLAELKDKATENLQENQTTNTIDLLTVSFQQDKNVYSVKLAQGSSVAETAFSMAIVIKCLLKDNIIKSSTEVLDLINKYLTDPQYEEVKENDKTNG